MFSRRGQVLSAELAMSAAIFFAASAIVLYAHARTMDALPPLANADSFTAFAQSERFFPYNGTAGGGIFLTAPGGSVNLSSCANLVDSLKVDELGTLDRLNLGAYRLGIKVTGINGTVLNGTCAGCSCGGCSISLDYAPGLASSFGEIAVIDRPARFVDADGNGMGLGTVRLTFYKGGTGP